MHVKESILLFWKNKAFRYFRKFKIQLFSLFSNIIIINNFWFRYKASDFKGREIVNTTDPQWYFILLTSTPKGIWTQKVKNRTIEIYQFATLKTITASDLAIRPAVLNGWGWAITSTQVIDWKHILWTPVGERQIWIQNFRIGTNTTSHCFQDSNNFVNLFSQ